MVRNRSGKDTVLGGGSTCDSLGQEFRVRAQACNATRALWSQGHPETLEMHSEMLNGAWVGHVCPNHYTTLHYLPVHYRLLGRWFFILFVSF